MHMLYFYQELHKAQLLADPTSLDLELKLLLSNT